MQTAKRKEVLPFRAAPLSENGTVRKGRPNRPKLLRRPAPECFMRRARPWQNTAPLSSEQDNQEERRGMRRAVFGRGGRTILVSGLLALALAGCRSNGAVSVAAPRKIVDLSPLITSDLMVRQLGHRACDFLGVKQRLEFSPIAPQNPQHAWGLGLSDLCIPSIAGAHLDAPSRLLKGGDRPYQVPLDQLFGPARLVELAWKDRHSALQVTDLEQTPISAGDIVILYVDYRPPQDEDWPTYSSLSPQAAQWLANKKIKALVTDMPSIGSFSRYADLMEKGRPPEEVWAEKLALWQAKIPVIEGLTNLGALKGETNIVFSGFPLAVDDHSGSPVRAVALVY